MALGDRTVLSDTMAKARPDKYDIIGLALVGLLATVWFLHFLLPAPPPEPPEGIGGPAIGPGGASCIPRSNRGMTRN
jgi:hypothetical protein